MDLHASLKNLGLSEKESAIYLALLQGGQATAYQLAKRSGLKKPTAYVILNELIARGAARKLMQGRGAIYVATDPVELFVEARSRFEQAERALPQLRALAHGDKKTINASYFEGLAGVQEMYKQLLEKTVGTTYVGFFAHEKDTPQALRDYWPKLNAEMTKRKITLRGVTTADPTTKEYLEFKKMPRELLQVKGLSPKEYSSNVSIEIYGDTTHILSHRYMQGLLIHNPDIADVLRQIFEMVWKKDDALNKKYAR